MKIKHIQAKGNSMQPKGIIELKEIIGVYSHDTNCIHSNRPKKMENTSCLHLHTDLRTYDFIGIETQEQAEKWVEQITFAVKSYSTKKAAKRWLKEKQALKQASEGDYSDLIDKVRNRKKKNLTHCRSLDLQREKEINDRIELMKQKAKEQEPQELKEILDTSLEIIQVDEPTKLQQLKITEDNLLDGGTTPIVGVSTNLFR
jgi:hypothetical protein